MLFGPHDGSDAQLAMGNLSPRILRLEQMKKAMRNDPVFKDHEHRAVMSVCLKRE